MKNIILGLIIGLGVLGWLWGMMTAAPENAVIRIIDGDTVEVMGKGRKPFTVRLQGIDAPEKGQRYAKKSKQALSRLVYKKIVRLEGTKRDRYGRTLARLYVDDMDVSAKMVEQGAAWVYRRYTRDSILYQAEAVAKENKRGLWAFKNPLPPWKWRKR